MDMPNNRYGIAGMTPRYHLAAGGLEKDSDIYLPSNGSLLAAPSPEERAQALGTLLAEQVELLSYRLG
jgi:hypothetical protein